MAHTHDHKLCKKTAVHEAEMLCEKHNLRFTDLRKNVLELIWKSHKSVKAYDLIKLMSNDNNEIKPPIVYRTLDFLIGNGFIHKIESSNSYVGCAHAKEQHSCQLMICNSCGDIEEICDTSITKKIFDKAKRKGFKIQKQTLEITGICSACLQTN